MPIYSYSTSFRQGLIEADDTVHALLALKLHYKDHGYYKVRAADPRDILSDGGCIGLNAIKILNKGKIMDKQTHFQQVGLFMETFGQDVRKDFYVPSSQVIKLRLSLILEEFIELFDSCIVSTGAYEAESDIRGDLMDSLRKINDISDNAIQLDHIGFADALTDLEYVVLGAGHAVGVDLDVTFDEVQRSNMSKLGEDGKPIYREDGKVMKGPNYSPPDLMAAIARSKA